jgi:transcription elongation factor
MIYVESTNPEDIRHAFDRMHTVYLHRGITLIPPSECTQLLDMPLADIAITEGHWVRVKNGVYKGDPGYVAKVIDASKVKVLLVPRIPYQESSVSARSPPALFDADRARTAFGQDAVRQVGDRCLIFQQMTFKDGLLEREYDPRQLSTTGSHPTFEEIALFGQSMGRDKEARRRWEADEAAAALCIHDRVEVIEGELTGTCGIITGKQDDIVQVQLHLDDNAPLNGDHPFELPARQVRKFFKIGDYIRVRHGLYAGKCGYVVKPCTDGALQFVESDRTKLDGSEVRVTPEWFYFF